MFRTIIFIAFTILFYSCAQSYKSLSLDKEIYYNKILTDSFDLNYKYDILKLNSNYVYARHEEKKGVKVVAINIVNKSDDTIDFKQDIKLWANGKVINYKSTSEIFKLLNQESALYFLGLFTFTFNTGSEGTSAGLYLSPVGLLYVLPNVFIASAANTNFRKDLAYYDATKLIILPHQVGYGLLCFDSNSNYPLMLSNSTDTVANSFSIQTNAKTENAIDTFLYFTDKYSSYTNYYDSLIAVFKQDPTILEIKLDQNYFSNGQIKSIGIKASHKYTENHDYLFKIGTWRYFYKNGQLKEYIDYDLEERKNGLYQKYDIDGKLINSNFYTQDKIIFYTVDEKPVLLGKAVITRKTGETIKCYIVFQDEKKVIIRTRKNSVQRDVVMGKNLISKIIYE